MPAPERCPIDAITRTANPARRVFHVIVSILGWAGFVWSLNAVFFRSLDRRAIPTLLLLVLVLLGIIAVNLLWVRFNLDLHAKRPKRTRTRTVEFTARADVLNRPLQVDWRRMRETGRIAVDLVRLEDGTEAKRYCAIPLPQPRRPVCRTRRRRTPAGVTDSRITPGDDERAPHS